MGWGSLEEALTLGSGVERSFVCPVHGSPNAHASVNSVTGYWYCYSCKASGKVDLTTFDYDVHALQRTISWLDSVIEPPRAHYSESFLAAYDSLGPGDYWLSRFSATACAHFRLGQSPDGSYATIPVRDVTGALLGVVQRDLSATKDPKYRYPKGLAMTDHLFNLHAVQSDDLVLVEGPTDAIAAYDTGLDFAVAMYGSSCSYAQRDLIRKYYPERVIVAFDQDMAGELGYERVRKLLGKDFPVMRLTWDGYKDLAEIPMSDRRDMLLSIARSSLRRRHG